KNVYSFPKPFDYLLGGMKLYLDKIFLLFYKNKKKQIVWSNNLIKNETAYFINKRKADIVQINWIGGGFLPISSFPQLKSKLIFRLDDMWAFTGGCHYSESCTKYETGCGSCPL